MKYTIENIASIVKGQFSLKSSNAFIENLLLDSRRVTAPQHSLFIALGGPRRDGHSYISELYEKGVRNFIVSKDIDVKNLEGPNIVVVKKYAGFTTGHSSYTQEKKDNS